jgi:hypothetical protein
VEDRMWWNHETLGLRFETTTTYAFISFVKRGLSGLRTQLLLRATGLIGDQLWNQAHASLVCTGRSSTQSWFIHDPKKNVSMASDTWVSDHYSPAHKSISSSAQYVTLQKCFSHPSLVIYFFATSPIKLKLDRKYVENY